MFAKIVVIGETTWTPATGPIVPEQQDVGVEDAIDLDKRSGDCNEVNIMSTQTEGSTAKRKKNTIGSSITGKGKKMKSRGATYLQRQLDHLCDAVKSYTFTSLSESSKKNYKAPAGSIEECMGVLLTLLGVEDGSELFMLDTHLFMK
ncbi:hypothetical protein SLE2022_344200 [Rubroshorea leprosula]